MSNVLRISESASLAIHALTILARAPEKRFSNTDIAGMLQASPNTLSKVMQRLAKTGLVQTQSGPHGGFSLTRPSAAIYLLEIHDAIEGPLGQPECLIGVPACDGTHCVLGGLVESIHQQVRAYFEKTTLAQIAKAVVIGEKE
jgi:Rrf2 family protein